MGLEAIPRGVSQRLFLVPKTRRTCVFCVARSGPTGQRIGTLRFGTFELKRPAAGLGLPRLVVLRCSSMIRAIVMTCLWRESGGKSRV